MAQAAGSRIDEFAEIMSCETGKPTDDARLELVLAVDHLAWAGKNAERVLGRRRVQVGMLMSNQSATLGLPAQRRGRGDRSWNYPDIRFSRSARGMRRCCGW